MGDQPLKGTRILVVEDSYLLAADARDWLTAAGAEVIGPVGSKEAALEAITNEEFDCAVVDLNLGNGANFQVAESLRESGRPFLFATGYDQPTIRSDFNDAVRLEKPLDPASLIAAVRKLT